jgi:ParB/RepB/Spo0J family partition protein
LYDQEGIVKLIDVKNIDPSPFQHRKYIDEEKLKELALSIEHDGLIQPIVVRPHNGRFQLIAGERRWRAVREYTDLKAIQARVIKASDLKARRMAAAENLQREDLSAIEKVEYIVDIVDSELIEDKEYALMGKEPLDRVKKILGSLHSITNSKSRGSHVSKKSELLLNKFIQQVVKILKNLPKQLV